MKKTIFLLLVILLYFVSCTNKSQKIIFNTDFTKDGKKENFIIFYKKNEKDKSYDINFKILDSKNSILFYDKFIISKKNIFKINMATGSKSIEELILNSFNKDAINMSKIDIIDDRMLSNSIINQNISIKKFNKIKSSILTNKKLPNFYYIGTWVEDFRSIVYLKEFNLCFIYNKLNEF